jgi:hypothetical protein
VKNVFLGGFLMDYLFISHGYWLAGWLHVYRCWSFLTGFGGDLQDGLESASFTPSS